MAEVKKRILFEVAHVFHRHSVAAKADPTLGYYGELRARYRDVLRAEVRRTVDTEAEVAEELHEHAGEFKEW